MKAAFAVLLICIVSVPFAASAEVYLTSSASCVSLTRDLFLGSKDVNGDVTSLQRFLVNQNYPGGGSWMVTGYYGRATEAAVKNFQSQSGLSINGYVDSATRSRIQQATCGTSYQNPYTYSYNNYTYQYPYNNYGQVLGAYTGPSYGCSYYNCQQQSINAGYLSPSSGAVGSTVTVYGSGFTDTNNTVHMGLGIVPFLRSSDGRTLSFTIPSNLSGYGSQPVYLQPYDVYVTNSRGENSNKLSFTVTGGSFSSDSRPAITNVSAPTSLSANASGLWTITVSGPANSLVTVNAIWGDEHLGTYSQNATQTYSFGNNGTQTFTFSHTYTSGGTYTPTFTATNSYGSNSTSASMTVGGYSSGSVSLNSLSSSSGQKGVQVVLYGNGFTQTENTIHFGIGGLRNVASVSNGTALYFTIPQYVSSCDLVIGSCSSTPTAVTPGTYPIYVTNSNGSTQTLNFTVYQ